MDVTRAVIIVIMVVVVIPVAGFAFALFRDLICLDESDPLKQKKNGNGQPEKLPQCPMEGLPDIATPLEERIALWSSAVESGKYKSWYPESSDEAWWVSCGLDKKAEAAGGRFTATSNRIVKCCRQLNELRRADIYPDGCRYLASLYYYGRKEIEDLYDAAKRLSTLRKTVNKSRWVELDTAFDKIYVAVDGFVTNYFENELTELVKLAVIKELKANDIKIESAPELPVHATTPEEIERLKLLIGSLLDGSRGKQPVLISEIYPD